MKLLHWHPRNSISGGRGPLRSVIGYAALIVAVSMLLAACGGGASDDGQGQEPAETTAVATTSEAPAATDEATAPASEPARIGISQCVTHPILDQVRAGIEQGLEQAGVDAEIDTQVSELDQSLATTIAEKFASQNVDLIVAICTPNALAARQVTSDIPIVFSYVTDAVAAGIVSDLEKPGENVTGTMFNPALLIDDALELTREVLPDATRLGVIANPGDEAAQALLAPLKEKAAAAGLEVVVAPIASSAEVSAAAESLVDRVDVILGGADGTVESAFAAVVKVANENGIPLVGTSIQDAQLGAAFSVADNPLTHGEHTAELIARVLGGEAPGDVPVFVDDEFATYVNTAGAAEQGLELPQSFVDQALEVFTTLGG